MTGSDPTGRPVVVIGVTYDIDGRRGLGAPGGGRYSRGEQGGGQTAVDVAGAAADILGLGFAARAGRLYEAAAAAKAAGAGQRWWIRWPASLEAFGLRITVGAFWFSGMMIDINSLMWGDYGSLNDIFGTGIFPALC